MSIKFPFPNPRLSPNKRIDRRALIADRQDARTIGFFLTKDAGITFKKTDALELKIVICPPDKRKRDMDNILSSAKNYIDGMFQALEMDDSAIKRIVLEWGIVENGGCLYVSLNKL